jgi:hypothetical protein
LALDPGSRSVVDAENVDFLLLVSLMA